jgi:hypothetical protein
VEVQEEDVQAVLPIWTVNDGSLEPKFVPDSTSGAPEKVGPFFGSKLVNTGGSKEKEPKRVPTRLCSDSEIAMELPKPEPVWQVTVVELDHEDVTHTDRPTAPVGEASVGAKFMPVIITSMPPELGELEPLDVITGAS